MNPAALRSSGEQFVDVGRGITLCYERLGDDDGEPMLLVAGLAQQLHSWPDALCTALIDRGYSLIRFDNRDAGRSTHLRFRPVDPVSAMLGRMRPGQYHLGDFARDAVGLLDALGVDSAHVVGMSMGGMIGQTMAAQHPWRVRSLASIMSNTGARRVGRPSPGTYRRMLSRPPRTRSAAAERTVAMYAHIGSQGLAQDVEWLREYAARAWDRGHDPLGPMRQIAAIFASGDRTPELRTITAPTVVVHGDRDRMVHPSGGAATARAIPGARLETIRGMGHDLPPDARDRIVALIDDNARRAVPAPAEAEPDVQQGGTDAEVPA